jgi:hypothetical protein
MVSAPVCGFSLRRSYQYSFVRSLRSSSVEKSRFSSTPMTAFRVTLSSPLVGFFRLYSEREVSAKDHVNLARISRLASWPFPLLQVGIRVCLTFYGEVHASERHGQCCDLDSSQERKARWLRMRDEVSPKVNCITRVHMRDRVECGRQDLDRDERK